MNTLIYFKNFVDEINSSNSRLHKQAVLERYANDSIIRRYLQIAFDPFKVYGVAAKKLTKRASMDSSLLNPNVFQLFEYLETHNTGTFADIDRCHRYLEHAASLDDAYGYKDNDSEGEYETLLKALICKDLSIGVDAKTINKVMPELIPTFNIQLANKYFDKPEYVEGKTFAITTKIDGGRIIAIKDNGQVSFYTRAGQKYEGLVDLEDEMSRLMPDNICLDGEITLFDKGELSSKEQYKETMKIVRTKDKEKHGIKMLVFDWMPAEDFKKQKSHPFFTYEERRKLVETIFMYNNFKYFELLPLLYVGTDTSKITEILDEVVAKGEEGIMINIYDALYEFKRTNNLLKVKKMQTIDLEIVGFEEGRGRLAGTLGAILVRYKNGNIVKVGSGFEDGLRDIIWEDLDCWLGAICEIQYFEETTNADGGESLRFPVFKDFRPDKLTADF